MPSPRDQDDSLAAALSKEISALQDTHSCSICHSILYAPVSLPCSHVFCSECARRHLRTKSTCPHPVCRKPSTSMQLTPLRSYDVALEPLRRSAEKVEPLKLNAESRLIFLSRKSSTRAQLLERLRAQNIPTHGGTDVIANRYNDFVVRWNANLDAGVPKSKKAIVAAVMAAEIAAAKVPKRPRATSSFFKKISSQESVGVDEIPVQGDDFETLVKKTRARMEKKRKLVAAGNVQNCEKRICLDTLGHSQKTELGSQATLINDPPKSLDNVSRPPAEGKSLEPIGVREDSNGVRDVSRDGISSQFDNNSPLVANSIEPASLAVHYNVCSIDVVSENINRGLGSNLGQTDKRIHTEGHNTNVFLSQAPLWSQTTPEKRVLPSDESHANYSPIHDARAIHSSMPSKARASMQDAQDSSGALSNQKVEQKKEPIFESINPGTVPAKKLEIQSPSPPLATDGRNMSTDPSGSIERSSGHGESQLETKKEDNAYRDVFRGAGNPSSTEVTPTKAQLERAERNRLLALERRRRFYEQNELSQMRQPDL